MARSKNTRNGNARKAGRIVSEGHPPQDVMPPCLLLDKLPPELRTTIYELAFVTNDDRKSPIDLQKCNPPSSAKALIQTCRQIYSEAAKLYRMAYREYWTDNDFYLWPSEEVEGPWLRRGIVDHVREDGLENIASLALYPQANKYSVVLGVVESFRLVDRRGVWMGRSKANDSKEALILLSECEIHDVIFENFCPENELEGALSKRSRGPRIIDQMEYLVGAIVY